MITSAISLSFHKRYVGAASYPIEMIILADKSGSMKGRRNTICNATISELLNTLTDDDFFNVIYVSNYIINKCIAEFSPISFKYFPCNLLLLLGKCSPCFLYFQKYKSGEVDSFHTFEK